MLTPKICEWYKQFQEGNKLKMISVGHPTTSTTYENIDKIKNIMISNHQITITEIAEEVGISDDLCETILTGILGMN